MQKKHKLKPSKPEVTYEEVRVNVPNNSFDTVEGILTIISTINESKNRSILMNISNNTLKKGLRKVLPINYDKNVPVEYIKQYNSEEYLLAVYKKLGIIIKDKANSYYYNVVLPKNLSIVSDDCGYWIKELSSGEPLIHYYDKGYYSDNSVVVDKINVFL